MEGGDDGGMDIAAVQALGREEKREFSWKEGKEDGLARSKDLRTNGKWKWQSSGHLGCCPSFWLVSLDVEIGAIHLGGTLEEAWRLKSKETH